MLAALAIAVSSMCILARAAGAANAADAVGPSPSHLWKGLGRLDEWAANVATNTAIMTSTRFREERLVPFIRKELAEPFLATDEANAEYAPEVLALIDDYARTLWKSQSTFLDPLFVLTPEITHRAEGLVRRGCRAPFVRLLATYAHPLDDVEYRTVRPDICAAITADVPDDEGCLFLRLLALAAQEGAPPGDKEGRRKALEAIEKELHDTVRCWAESRAREPGDMRVIYRLLVSEGQNYSLSHARANARHLVDSPTLGPFFGELIEAERLRSQAWKIRGTGYAYTVSEDAWPVFHRLMDQSAELLRSAWRRYPTIPETAVLMLQNRREACSAPRSGDTFDDWIARAMEEEVDNGLLWGEMSQLYLDKWHGSPSIRKSLAEACRKTGRTDTSLLYWYVIFIEQLRPRDDSDAFKYFFDSELAQPLYDSIANLIAGGVLSDRREENMKRHQVIYLLLLGFYEESLQKWRQYGFDTTLWKWGSTHVFPHDLWRVSVLGILDGPYGDRIMPIAKLYRAGNFTEYISELDAFLSEIPPLTETERNYLEEMREVSLRKLEVPPKAKLPTPGLLPAPPTE